MSNPKDVDDGAGGPFVDTVDRRRFRFHGLHSV